jgi:hypothetical protein
MWSGHSCPLPSTLVVGPPLRLCSGQGLCEERIKDGPPRIRTGVIRAPPAYLIHLTSAGSGDFQLPDPMVFGEDMCCVFIGHVAILF